MTAHAEEWLNLVAAMGGTAGLLRIQNSRGWAEAERLEDPTGAVTFKVFAGRLQDGASFRATLPGCAGSLPSCPHDRVFRASRSALGYGYGSLGAGFARGCTCRAYRATTAWRDVRDVGDESKRVVLAPEYGLCPGTSGFRPGDVASYLGALITTYAKPVARPVRGPVPSTTIKYDPKHVPNLELA